MQRTTAPEPGHPGDGFDTAIVLGSRWTTAGIGEALPGVLPPLVWDTAAPLYEDGFRALYGRRGGLPPELDDLPFVARIGGCAVLSLDAMEAATRASQRGRRAGALAVAELDRQYLGDAAGGAAGAAAGGAAKPNSGLRAHARARRGASRSQDRVEAETVALAAAALAGEALPSTWTELVRWRRRFLDLGHRAVVAETAVAADAAGAYHRLEALLRRSVGEAASHWAQRLTASASLPLGGPDVAAQRSRSVFAGPTWAEAGLSPPSAPPLGGTNEVAAATAWNELLTELDGGDRPAIRALTGQLVDIRLVVLRRAVEDAVELLGQRERTKLAVLSIGGAVRRAHRAMGADLVAAGVLASLDDVDLLGADELVGRRARPAPDELDRRRAWCAARHAEPEPPLVVVGGPADRATSVRATDRFTGTGCSPGRLRAVARVVLDPLVDEIEPGEVMIATTTDPSWQALFLVAGAVVVERGGPLAHAAILARELGIPAVLGVDGVVDALTARAGSDGHTVIVEVDGDAGVVDIVAAEAEATDRLSSAGGRDAH